MKRLLGWTLLLLLAALFLLNAVHVVRAEDTDDDDAADADDASTTPTEPKSDDATAGASTEEPKDSTKEDDKTSEEIEEEDDAAVLKASPDIITTVYFPGYSEKKFPVGTDVQLLLGVHNKGKASYNVSFIGAYLHSPFDLDYYIQNFSVKAIEELVEPGEEQTFDFTFRPDQRLEPLEFWLSAYVIYNNTDTSQIHQTVFVNGTIELVEKPSDMNFRRVFTYFLAFAAAGLVGYIAWHVISPKGSGGSTERGTRDESGAGWVPDKVYSQSKARPISRKRKDAPKPKAPGTPKKDAAAPASPRADDSDE